MIKKTTHLLFLPLLFLISCHSPNTKEPHTIKIEASSAPQAQILEQIKPELKNEGIDLCIIIVDDYNIPNRAVADKEADANFFQHMPFLEEQIRQFHYPLCVLAKTHIEPMGIYSRKETSLQDLADGSTIAIPNDPTNEARALLLLQNAGIISLKSKGIAHTTILDIDQNPHHFVFKEIDAALLPRTLDEVEAAVIPTNYALQAGYSPMKDALLIEGEDSAYVNVIVVRCDDMNNPDLLALKKAMNSKQMRDYMLKTYDGAVVPAF